MWYETPLTKARGVYILFYNALELDILVLILQYLVLKLFGIICVSYVDRLLLMLLIWWDHPWISRGSHSLTLRLRLVGSPRRRISSKQWRLLVCTFHEYIAFLFFESIHFLQQFVFVIQMLRTSGRIAHGEESWLWGRGGQPSTILIGSRLCWQRSRLV